MSHDEQGTLLMGNVEFMINYDDNDNDDDKTDDDCLGGHWGGIWRRNMRKARWEADCLQWHRFLMTITTIIIIIIIIIIRMRMIMIKKTALMIMMKRPCCGANCLEWHFSTIGHPNDLDEDEDEDIFWGPIKERACVLRQIHVGSWDILVAIAKLSPVTRSNLYCFPPITDSPSYPSVNILLFLLHQLITVVSSETAEKNLKRRQYFAGLGLIIFFERSWRVSRKGQITGHVGWTLNTCSKKVLAILFRFTSAWPWTLGDELMIPPCILWTVSGRWYGGEEELRFGQFEDRLSLFPSPHTGFSVPPLRYWTFGLRCVQHSIYTPQIQRHKMLS